MEQVKKYLHVRRGEAERQAAITAWKTLSWDDQRYLMNEVFIDCLQQCEQKILILDSHHPNKNFKLFTVDEPVDKGILKFAPFIGHLKISQHPAVYSNDFFDYLIETVLSYLQSITSDRSEFSLQTPTITYSTKLICADILHILDWALQHFDCSVDSQSRTKIFYKIIETFATLGSHPEVSFRM